MREQQHDWTVGVLVQTNYGGRLTIAGVPVWKELSPSRTRGVAATADRSDCRAERANQRRDDGSCMIVVATDAPLDARDLERLAARAIYAMARTGSTYSNGSGDFAIAFSTHPSLRVTAAHRPAAADRAAHRQRLGPVRSGAWTRPRKPSTTRCCKAVDTTGNGRTIRALPIDPLKALLKKRL